MSVYIKFTSSHWNRSANVVLGGKTAPSGINGLSVGGKTSSTPTMLGGA